MAEIQECHEEVIGREGYFVPCEKPAVGYRIDPSVDQPYPVCKKHLQPEIFVPDYLAVLGDWQEREDTNAVLAEASEEEEEKP
jgi:hypothetical protein